MHQIYIPQEELPRRIGAMVLIASCFMCLPFAAWAAEFTITSHRLYDLNGEYFIDSTINYELNESTLEALENGIPLTFETHVQVRRSDAWIWESDLMERRIRVRLSYHPLSSLYEVYDLAARKKSEFATRQAALETLGRITALPVIHQSQLSRNEVYQVTLQSRLDIEALPLPLRPLAHISPKWRLESDAWEWELKR